MGVPAATSLHDRSLRGFERRGDARTGNIRTRFESCPARHPVAKRPANLGYWGGFGLRTCASRGWVAGTWLQMPIIALALSCFGLAQWLGGSGFIASFVGGLIFGASTKHHKEEFLSAAEGTADAVAMVTWFAFGAVVPGLLLDGLDWKVLTYAILSLTLIRMIPVFLCLIGKGLRNDTLLFMGWFGPRGLASIVFLVMVTAQQLPGAHTIVAVVSWTIVLSVLFHGLSANPLARVYGTRVGDADI